MIAEKINKLGFVFDQPFDVKGRISISDIFPKSKPRCGVYLLRFADETFYIGQSLDAVRRFSEHQKVHNNIEKLWFRPIAKHKLDETEQRLIQLAEVSKILLTNKTFISSVIGSTDLDLILSPDEQVEWLENDTPLSKENYNLYSNIDLKHKVRHRQNFVRFQNLENFDFLKEVLNLYITKCIPSFRRTEMSFWSLSCLPSTNNGTFPRLFCINVNAMEVFVLGYEKRTKNHFSFLITSKRFKKSKQAVQKRLRKYKSLKIFKSEYQAAGTDQIRMEFSDLDELKNVLLTDNEVIASIKEMNLRLMRKGGTIYSKHHCFDLANAIISEG